MGLRVGLDYVSKFFKFLCLLWIVGNNNNNNSNNNKKREKINENHILKFDHYKKMNNKYFYVC